MTPSSRPLTHEQLAALSKGIRLIEAGPGAGKTLTVVARFRQQALGGRGVALLSFTNRAIDVARSRLQGTPSLLEPPHFVGTFDQFLHRFVTTPYVMRQHGKKPQYVASWGDLTHDLRRIRVGNSNDGFELSDFTLDGNGDQRLPIERLKREEKQLWDAISEYTQKQVLLQAARRVAQLKEAHVYDCESARALALGVLAEPQSIYLRRLAMRFGEVIVDELQDCNELDHELLARLQNAGMHVVGVADPDQSIYDFRRPTIDVPVDPYLTFKQSLSINEIAPLTICHRSTPAICKLVSSLRKVSDEDVVASEDPPVGPDVIHVVFGGDSKAGKAAMQIVRDAGIKPDVTWILAATRGKARSVSQRSSDSAKGGTAVAALLNALTRLRSQGSARIRSTAVYEVESFLLRMLEWPSEKSFYTRQDQLDHLSLTAEELRVAAVRVVSASRGWLEKSDCSQSLRVLAEAFASSLPIDLVSNFGTKAMVRTDVWDDWQAAKFRSEEGDTALANYSHIHSVKGEEFEAVILSLTANRRDGDHALDDWERDINTEQRRVLYVGASRARRCLVLVAPLGKKGQVRRILRGSGIAFVEH